MKLSYIFRHLQSFCPSGFMSAYNSCSRSVTQVDSPVGNDSRSSGFRNRPMFILFLKPEHLIAIQNSHSIWAINGDRVRRSIFRQGRNTIRATDCRHMSLCSDSGFFDIRTDFFGSFHCRFGSPSRMRSSERNAQSKHNSRHPLGHLSLLRVQVFRGVILLARSSREFLPGSACRRLRAGGTLAALARQRY